MAYFKNLERSAAAKAKEEFIAQLEKNDNLPYPNALKDPDPPTIEKSKATLTQGKVLKIGVCIPIRAGFVSSLLLPFVVKVIMPITRYFASESLGHHPHKFKMERIFFGGRSYNVALTRNELVRQALSIGVDAICFIDDDGYPEDSDIISAIQKLVETNAPIAGAVVRVKKNNKLAARKTGTGGYWVIPKEQVIVDCDGVGFGCVLIRKEVFEKVPEPWFSFRDMERSDEYESEDYAFCKRAKELGFSIKLRTDVRFSHIASAVLRADTGSLEIQYL